MYSQVPFLIDQIPRENSLDVMRAMQTTLNELLAVKYRIMDNDAQSKYAEAWVQKKESLLMDRQEAP